MRNFTISVAFYGEFALIGVKKLQIENSLDILPGQSASKHKKTLRVEWMIFFPCYKYGQKIYFRYIIIT